MKKYVNAFKAHTARGVAQGFKPLTFSKFVSLAKHLEVTSWSAQPVQQS